MVSNYTQICDGGVTSSSKYLSSPHIVKNGFSVKEGPSRITAGDLRTISSIFIEYYLVEVFNSSASSSNVVCKQKSDSPHWRCFLDIQKISPQRHLIVKRNLYFSNSCLTSAKCLNFHLVNTRVYMHSYEGSSQTSSNFCVFGQGCV